MVHLHLKTNAAAEARICVSITGGLPAMEHEGLAKGRRRCLVGNVCRELGRGSHPLKAQHCVRKIEAETKHGIA